MKTDSSINKQKVDSNVIPFSSAKKLAAKKSLCKSAEEERSEIDRINEDFNYITLINNPTEAMQLAAVEKWGNVIRYLDNPSEAVKIAAVTNWPEAIGYIDNPSRRVLEAAETARNSGICAERVVEKSFQDGYHNGFFEGLDYIYGLISKELGIEISTSMPQDEAIRLIKNALK